MKGIEGLEGVDTTIVQVADKKIQIMLNPSAALWTGYNEITTTHNRNGVTFYLDTARDFESLGGTDTSAANGGKLGSQSIGDGVGAPYDFGAQGIALVMGGSYSSLFEGMVVKTADGQDVYASADSKVGILRTDTNTTEGYLADGSTVTITDAMRGEPTYTKPYHKVIGIKVKGACQIGAITPGSKSRPLLFIDEDGKILNVDSNGNSIDVSADNIPASILTTGTDNNVPCFAGNYDGDGESEIYICHTAGGMALYGIELYFPQG